VKVLVEETENINQEKFIHNGLVMEEKQTEVIGKGSLHRKALARKRREVQKKKKTQPPAQRVRSKKGGLLGGQATRGTPKGKWIIRTVGGGEEKSVGST